MKSFMKIKTAPLTTALYFFVLCENKQTNNCYLVRVEGLIHFDFLLFKMNCFTSYKLSTYSSGLYKMETREHELSIWVSHHNPLPFA